MSAAYSEMKPDPRRATRFPVDFQTICENRRDGEFAVQITNISAHGCQIVHETSLDKGDRIIVRLPNVGRIEAVLIWMHGGRSGFEYERILRQDEFMALLDEVAQL